MSKGEKYADLGLAASLLREGKVLRAEKEVRLYLSVRPNDANAIMLLGAIKSEAKQYRVAIPLLKRSVALLPRSAQAHYNLAKALFGFGDLEAARDHFVQSIEIEADHAESHNNLGSVYFAQGQDELARQAYEHALKLNPQCQGVSFNLGIVLLKLYRWKEAARALQAATAQDPSDPRAHYGFGISLCECGKFDDAAKVFSRIVEIDPENGAAASFLAHTKRMTADWDGLAAVENNVLRLIDSPKTRDGYYVNPFPLSAISDDPAILFRCAKRAAQQPTRKYTESQLDNMRAVDQRRLKIAYVSGDFREHATSRLIAGFIEEHDRKRFEVFGISFGPDDKSAVRRRMKNAFEVFLDVQDQSPQATADLMRKHEIDIAIDLVGWAQLRRTEIFANRAAPVQANYLGWPGTMATRYMDYIVADPIIIPEDQYKHYSEAVVHLPECYQPNDQHRPLPTTIPTRASCGLPDQAIVFCCFNSPYKIGPLMFDIWGRILNQVPGSVLWLIENTRQTCENLRRQAIARGVDGARLVFAPWVQQAAHLARLRNADIFLDTLPYNAHTTASDALWSGIAVVTCNGNSFASRVGSSLVMAAGAPELSTSTLEEYENLAIELATNRNKLLAIKARLEASRTSSSLFDQRRLCRHVEKAYQTMQDRRQRGLPAESFRVDLEV
ncbi:tetratricopeptide repeat protein [Hyphomicrobium sp.]|jgi:predicted O-linked N-acetylglucosamine transferase (SPINDLY family)|uniref:O-linked N-acetylglucosamine transferase, SPINDLY family protein n=1 Tax=Hyphomicrobium sp. TaxID=82 RepID=UPI003568329F